MTFVAGLRIRISTVLLLLALPTYPFMVFWLPEPWVPETPEIFHKAICWVLFEMPAQLILLAAIASIFGMVILAVKRNWTGVLQSVSEICICFVAVLFIPAQ
jgi:hypothetical protein